MSALTLDYQTVKKHLKAKHPKLSSSWFSFGYNEDNTVAYVMYNIGDHLPIEEAIVNLNGDVIASDRLIEEMNAIS